MKTIKKAKALATLAMLPAALMLTTGQAAAQGKPSDIGLLHWSCGRAAPPDIDTSGNHETVTAANMRVGSSTRCASAGVSFPDERLDYHCWARDINGINSWTYVVNVETGGRGWIRDDLLNDFGSARACPGQTPPTT